MSYTGKIGKYPIVRTLGEGAMGVVYEAFDPLIQRPLAIKTIRRALLSSDEKSAEAIARFKTEAQAAGRLSHPGIAAVYEYGEDEQCVYIAMEYVSGNTLREYILRKTVFAEEDVLSIMSQLLDALGYAHSRKVLHRDIKPANLMITREGRLKITDFGIARVEASDVTLVGAVIGTPGYMAPEQFGGDHIDHRVDLYAAAATLYKLLTGELPFSGSLEQVMYKTVMTDPRPPSQFEGAARWRHFDPVVLRGLAKDRDQRYESAAGFREALVALAQKPLAQAISEHTLIMEPIRPLSGGHASPPIFGDTHASGMGSATGHTSAGGTRGSGSGAAYPSHWDPTTLAQLESELARHIGPVAKVLIRRAAVETSDLVALRHRLAAHLGSEAERSQFLEGSVAVVARPQAGAATRTALAAGAATLLAADWDPALLAQLELKLAKQIGPVAKVLVRRAAARIADFGVLVDTLAAELTSETERSQFLSSTAALVPRLVQRRGADTTGAMPAPAPAWDTATLARLEVPLARVIGPVARAMVRRAAAQTTDFSTLCDLLATQLTSTAERTEFLNAVARSVGSAATVRTEPGGTWVGTAFPLTGAKADASIAPAAEGALPSVMQDGLVAGGCATLGGSPSADATSDAGGTAMAAPNWNDPVDDALLDHATQVLARRLGPIARMMVARAASRASTRGAFCLALVKLAADATDGEALMADLRKAPGTR